MEKQQQCQQLKQHLQQQQQHQQQQQNQPCSEIDTYIKNSQISRTFESSVRSTSTNVSSNLFLNAKCYSNFQRYQTNQN